MTVTEAMAEQRPDKERVRKRWVDCVADVTDREGYWYVTLAGVHALDIRGLVEAGIIETTSAGGIAREHLGRVAIIEQDLEAADEIRRRLPGVKIERTSVANLLAGTGMHATAASDVMRTGAVFNFDFNSAVRLRSENGRLMVEVARLAHKLANQRSTAEHAPFTLCVTNNADVRGSDEELREALAFLAANMRRSPDFADSLQALVGEGLSGAILRGDDIAFHDLAYADRSRLLMALVPKAVAKELTAAGWEVSVALNCRYGGDEERGAAAMVSWIIGAEWSGTNPGNDDLRYEAAVARLLANPIFIAPDGDEIRDRT